MDMPDILETGEDVTEVPSRALILRAVNTSIAAKLAADRMEDTVNKIADELKQIRSLMHAFLDLFQRGEIKTVAVRMESSEVVTVDKTA
jgi:hypothetical protein